MAWINNKASKPKHIAERKPFAGYTGGHKKLYNSKQWQVTRMHVLMNNPMCGMCADEGIETIANEVDHIVSLSQGGSELHPSNLQPLCTTCHRRKTGKESMMIAMRDRKE